MKKIIGIDLGTSNSVVAVMEGGEPTIIPNSEGARTTPSVVSFSNKKDGERMVGALAKRQAVTNPENTIFSSKRIIGKTYKEVREIATHMPYKITKGAKDAAVIQIGDRQYMPGEIAAMILQKLKGTATDYLGSEPQDAVITVPAYFNDQERQATKEAGKIAGLDVKRIINEPTAAALAYGFGKKDEDCTILVFDLGGGTFDVSILHCGDGVFEVKATSGDVSLGGDNFDERIINWLLKEFSAKEGIDLKKDIAALQRLKEAAEKAKQELSTVQKTEINLPYITADATGPKHLIMDISRSKFEQLCDDLFDKMIAPCQKAMKDSGLTIEEIDKVILVGGSTRIPKVQQIVKDIFKKDPVKSVNPDEVVAVGAAIQGGVLAGNVKGIVLLDVTPLSLGIETQGGVFTKLIESNTTIPTKKSEIFSTAEDNQPTVDIKVYQGERRIAHYNRLVGQFHLDGIPPAPRGTPQIEVTFDIDVNGILSVSAKDKKTNKEQSIRIEASSNLSKEEIEKMRKEAEAHAEEDRKEKNRIEKLNKADAIAFQMEKSKKEHKDKLSEELQTELDNFVNKIKKAHKEKDINTIDTLIKESTQWQQKLFQAVADHEKTKKEQGQNQPQSPPQSEEKVQDVPFEEVKEKK